MILARKTIEERVEEMERKFKMLCLDLNAERGLITRDTPEWNALVEGIRAQVEPSPDPLAEWKALGPGDTVRDPSGVVNDRTVAYIHEPYVYYIGGGFTRLDYLPRSGYQIVSPPPDPVEKAVDEICTIARFGKQDDAVRSRIRAIIKEARSCGN